MHSVTSRIKEITKDQPRGGFVPIKDFNVIEINDGSVLHDIELENIHASLVGMSVDYLSRYMYGYDKDDAFKISMYGARLKGEEKTARQLLSNINGLDDLSIISACKLCGYDVVYRNGGKGFKPISLINPNTITIENIKVMVERSVAFLNKYGPIVKDGFTFEGGYTDVISSGDGDFLTCDTIWDFKVSKSNPTKDHTLQLLIYYLMGQQSINDYFTNISTIGIYNPRRNIVYTKKIKEIDVDTMKYVEHNIIGYDNPELNNEYRLRSLEEERIINSKLNRSNKKNSKNKSQNQFSQLVLLLIVLIIVFVILLLYH